jgi:hypothetical protein
MVLTANAASTLTNMNSRNAPSDDPKPAASASDRHLVHAASLRQSKASGSARLAGWVPPSVHLVISRRTDDGAHGAKMVAGVNGAMRDLANA